MLGDEGNKEPDRWSADGRYILFDYTGKKTKATDIWALPMFGDHKPFPVIQGPEIDYYGMSLLTGNGWLTNRTNPDGVKFTSCPFPDREANGRFLPAAAANLYGRPARS